MKTILIVDDNKANLTTARIVLNQKYKTICVTSGKQALSYLQMHKADLILLDFNMPQMDGFEVMEHIRANEDTKNIPIIFLTANNDVELESRCLRKGAADFVMKPFVPEVMLARIDRVLELEEYHRQLTEKLLEEKAREIKTYKKQSQKDVLTGLWNRSYIDSYVVEKILAKEYCAFFMIDMDNFKSINDTYGHIAGDHTLKAFADVLREKVGKEDVVCRLGGDEFVIFVANRESIKEVKTMAEEIIDEMGKRLKEKQYMGNPSVSIGIARYPQDGQTFEELYGAADKALYHVKQNGKSNYYFYNETEEVTALADAIVDLINLKNLMKMKEPDGNSYMMDFDHFQHIYEFVRRMLARNPEDVQMVLFTIKQADDKNADVRDMENAISYLQQSILYCLRREDVSARYSSCQMLVILMGADTENGDMVAKRIVQDFTSRYKQGNCVLDYGIVQIDEES